VEGSLSGCPIRDDRAKLHNRITIAEQALVLRARELFQTAGDHIEEGEAIEDAMYALHALRNTYSPERRSTLQTDAA
jgi:hypothetical protein